MYAKSLLNLKLEFSILVFRIDIYINKNKKFLLEKMSLEAAFAIFLADRDDNLVQSSSVQKEVSEGVKQSHEEQVSADHYRVFSWPSETTSTSSQG